MSDLRLFPITRADAQDFIARHHRHNRPPAGDLFRVAVTAGDEVVGVAMVGRPVSREIQRQEPQTAELIRVCTKDGAPRNACSMLYGAARRAAWALGYTRLITYTLKSESGASLKASGYRVIGERKGRSWNCPSRPRVDGHVIEDRLLWEAA